MGCLAADGCIVMTTNEVASSQHRMSGTGPFGHARGLKGATRIFKRDHSQNGAIDQFGNEPDHAVRPPSRAPSG